MTRHTRSLAQHAAWNLTAAQCRDLTLHWATLEADYRAAASPTEAQQHLDASRLICDGCPVAEPCAERARLDRYTGIAAGTGYTNGRAHRDGARS